MIKNKLIFSGVCLLFGLVNSDPVQANSTLIKSNNIMNVGVFGQVNNSPEILTDLNSNYDTVEFKAILPETADNLYNYIVFYDKQSDGKEKELFRLQLKNSMIGRINDSRSLKSIANNMQIFARIESYKLENNKFILQEKSSASPVKYTPKQYKLVIKEDDNVVYDNIETYEIDKLEKYNFYFPVYNLRKYPSTKYYTYENSKYIVDGKEVLEENNNIEINYYTEEIQLNLQKNSSQWTNVIVKHPSSLEKSKTIDVKVGTEFKKFVTDNNKLFLDIVNNENYTFVGYEIVGVPLESYVKDINTNVEITAVYDTTIHVNNETTKRVYKLKTGEKLSEIDMEVFEKSGYDIVGFTLVDNTTKEEKYVESLNNEVVENSLTIIPKYEEKKHLIKIRQDDYNKRFGQVAEDIANKDINWSENKPIEELLAEIKEKITPNKGYDVQFRINRKEVDPNTYIKEDTVIEIYFKKNQQYWSTVKFVGEGIDKFLSDGQDVLIGSRIDTINLPTSLGSQKKFIGWEANIDYKININGKIINRSKDQILKNSDLPLLIAEKNIILTAVYEKKFEMTIKNSANGIVQISNSNNNNLVIEVSQNNSIKETLKNNRILLLPKSHYKFSHFTSTLPVFINKGGGELKIIQRGEPISLVDFYNIVPENNLTFEPHFVFYNGIFDNGNLLEKTEVEDILNISQEKNYSVKLEDALGPLYFLR